MEGNTLTAGVNLHPFLDERYLDTSVFSSLRSTHSMFRDIQLWTSYIDFQVLGVAVLGCKMIVRRRLLEDYELIGLVIGVD